tara:strand:+ start:109 stop:2043 length:1935 start_codon:yes stop_codon:yes gene_type:complete
MVNMMEVIAVKINTHYDGWQPYDGTAKMTEMTLKKFLTLLTGLCLAYLGFEWWFNQFTMISVDEFWFAHRINEYQSGLPYRDFSPYKTVLGYYLLLLPISLSHGVMSTLILTKNVIAIANASILFLASCWLTRYFSRAGVLAALVLLLLTDTMLSYSTQIRVDLLAYWFCLFSLLCLLDRRFIVAGLLMGLGFSTSQKAIWYLFASNTALGVHWLFAARNRHFFLDAVKFNVATVAVIGGYLALWSAVVDWSTIFNSVFIEASAMYHLGWYNATRGGFWSLILQLNPLAFMLWPLALLSLMITFPTDHHYAKRRFITVYALTIMFCLIPYKQVFLYYMQVTLPVFLVLYAAFFSWLLALPHENTKCAWLVDRKWAWVYSVVYLSIIFITIHTLSIPYAYLLVAVIPFLILQKRQHQLLLLNFVFIGLIYPAIPIIGKMASLDNQYQKTNIAVINTLLNDNTDYVAGIELIYNRSQPIAGLRHLMGPAIDYLYNPTDKIKPVMTASLYEDASATSASVIQDLAKSKVKFYVNNYRMNALPPVILSYLNNHYQHLWGSIYFYSPVIAAGNHTTAIQFTGNYEVKTKQKTAITINGKPYHDGSRIALTATTITSQAMTSFRLSLLPDNQALNLDQHFQKDEWQKIIF